MGPVRSSRRPEPARVGEGGQTVALIVVFMFVMLGMCAVAIDVGSWLQDRRAAQAAADASALAGASQLPAGWSNAQTAATSEFTASKAINATATATVLSYTKVVSAGQVMPWGVMRNSWVLGQQYSLYVDNSTPNNGALSLKGKDSSNNCLSTSGANDYSNEINSVLPVCDISVGDIEPVKTGQNTGPT